MESREERTFLFTLRNHNIHYFLSMGIKVFSEIWLERLCDFSHIWFHIWKVRVYFTMISLLRFFQKHSNSCVLSARILSEWSRAGAEGGSFLRIKTLRRRFPAAELSALWKRFQHTLNTHHRCCSQLNLQKSLHEVWVQKYTWWLFWCELYLLASHIVVSG